MLMLENISTQSLTSPSQPRNLTTGNGVTTNAKPLPQPVKLQQTSEQIQLKEQSAENMREIVDGLNHFLKPTQSMLKFQFHDQLNEYYITLVDEVTKEVVKEIPPKKMLDFYAAMTEKIGLLVDKKI